MPKFVNYFRVKQGSMLFSDKIRSLRETEKITQRTMAKALGIGVPMYCRIERGERSVRKEQIPVIAEALKTNSEELLKLWLADQMAALMNGEEEVFNDVMNITKDRMKKTNFANGKFGVLDLFCGCGGISKGFEMSGYSITGGIDFNKDATDTFARNFKNAKVICGDISEVTDDQIRSLYGKTDVIIGGPPCQGFSSANRWQKEKDDPRNKLFFQYIRFVDVLRPKAILIENVRGLLTRDNGYAKDRITELLTKMNYSVSVSVLDASDYGVPQCRKRAIVIGINKDLCSKEFDFSKLKVLPKVTVDDAISDIYGFEGMIGTTQFEQTKPMSSYQKLMKDGTTVLLDHEVRYPADIVQKRISFVPQGGNWSDVPSELWPSQRNNRHSSAYKRLKQDAQSCTIDTGNAHSNYFHPLFNRIPSVRESARLQSFPDSFEFEGSRGSKYKQVGNAVPPLLAKAIADLLKEYIK